MWAIINGEKEAGITLFQLNAGVDSGPIVSQERIPIQAGETITTLQPRVFRAAISLLGTFLTDISSGHVDVQPQDDEKATTFPQRSPADGLIDWNLEGEDLVRFINAQTKPYPGAFTIIEGRKLIIWKADFEQTKSRSRVSEKIFKSEQPIEFLCLDGTVTAIDYEFEM